MEKINVAELLRGCPSGMELDCLTFDNVFFQELDCSTIFPIICYRINNGIKEDMYLTEFGSHFSNDCAKCVIFPKGKTTWEGFHRPFKDGDVITCNNIACTFVSIFKDKPTEKSFKKHCSVILNDNKFIVGIKYADYANPRFATEEEKAKLFKAIKDNGYKWNPDTKTLEKLIQPKFKVGDSIVHKKNRKTPFVITEITKHSYKGGTQFEVLIEQQDNFELVPTKYDITNLKPFESRVLVRDSDGDLWKPAIYGFSNSKGCYVVGGLYWRQCIPYEANKELLGTTYDCDDYKTCE